MFDPEVQSFVCPICKKKNCIQYAYVSFHFFASGDQLISLLALCRCKARSLLRHWLSRVALLSLTGTVLPRCCMQAIHPKMNCKQWQDELNRKGNEVRPIAFHHRALLEAAIARACHSHSRG